MTRRIVLAVLGAVLVLCLHPAVEAAADAGIDDAAVAARAARLETLRARLATVSSPAASASLIEAETLLRHLRGAAPAKREAIAAQLDTVLTRAEIEIAGASRPKP